MCKSYSDQSFNKNSVDDFIKEYRDTIHFAKLREFDTLSLDAKDKQRIKIGDCVRWESQGVIQFEAKRVTGFSDDRTFAFIEGSNAGLPIDQLSKVDAPEESGNGGTGRTFTPPKHVLPSAGMNTEVFTLDEGEATRQDEP
jgi:hypothetical protein